MMMSVENDNLSEKFQLLSVHRHIDRTVATRQDSKIVITRVLNPYIKDISRLL